MKYKLLFLATALLFLATGLFADSYVDDFNDRERRVIRDLEDAGWIIADEVGRYHDVYEDDYFTIERTVYEGNEYKVIAFGDDDATDIDIFIYNSDWSSVTRDQDFSRYAEVDWVTRRTNNIYIKVLLFDADFDWARIGYVIAYRKR